MLILEGFFINFCILCTGIFLIHHYFTSELAPSKNTIRRPIRRGIMHGLFGIILMHFGIQLKDGLLIDLRSIPIMMAAYVGGGISAGIAAAILIVFRLSMYPITFASLNNIYVLGLSAIVFSFICRSRLSDGKKWILMPASFIVILGSTFHLVVPEVKMEIIIFMQYAISVGCGALGTYMIKSYLCRNDESYERIKEASRKDHLTGLHNVRSFDQQINAIFLNAKEQGKELSLLAIDIDHFKGINDTYGHPAGDKVIARVSELLLLSSRPVDVVSRNGGEEFSILMPECNSQSAEAVAERVRLAVEKSIFAISEQVELRVTVSVGYATMKDGDIGTVSQLIGQADQGLYKAKLGGRNLVMAG
ncbi:diguanylate cyclase [Bacillus sp. V5-8f]|uniref:GGDEF domain-containing protein n=1 Tax=Bacillus sp. V5-8f TaxID=2053044 RepID=UPI000C78016C|nr:diguanylate cyclase [Bacillus sp. V5-8f]PLT33511.1 hypothetical protein CUU64_13135 [Bacillus sp. V5-8f]